MLRESTLEKEGMLQVSRWTRLPILAEREELECFFESLGEFQLYAVHGICKKGQEIIDPTQFLNIYSTYLDSLKAGDIWNRARLTEHFSPVLTCSSDLLYSIRIDEESCLVRASRPVIQLQPYAFHYDGQLRSMLFGENSISWGIQFSYPFLYQDSQTFSISNVRETPSFPNTKLFRMIQSWIRKCSTPTPIVFKGIRKMVPIRLGKTCFNWINRHPQLKSNGLKIDV